MSNQNDDTSYEDEGNSSEAPKGLREALKAAQARVKELEPQVEELSKYKREGAFRDVGLDVKKPAVQDFIEAYKGDLTEQAIREAAEVRGHLEPAAPEIPATELDGLQRMSAASAGATPATPGDTQAILNDYTALLEAGKGEEAINLLRSHGYADVMQ